MLPEPAGLPYQPGSGNTAGDHHRASGYCWFLHSQPLLEAVSAALLGPQPRSHRLPLSESDVRGYKTHVIIVLQLIPTQKN